jgi:hypothetical protein
MNVIEAAREMMDNHNSVRRGIWPAPNELIYDHNKKDFVFFQGYGITRIQTRYQWSMADLLATDWELT